MLMVLILVIVHVCVYACARQKWLLGATFRQRLAKSHLLFFIGATSPTHTIIHFINMQNCFDQSRLHAIGILCFIGCFPYRIHAPYICCFDKMLNHF